MIYNYWTPEIWYVDDKTGWVGVVVPL